MWASLFIVLSILSMALSGSNKKNCGGTYTAARGILSTPNFPGPFKVPINCEWVIDAQFSSTPNTSIVVYLTQLFVYEGLTFTEYQIYGDDYKINPKVIHKVNETNISRTRWIKTFQSFLVIRLKLTSADSVHLRVLDKFLDVYGFNITYEITTGSVRGNSCTMMDCGFTGNCYDYYTKFNCHCLEGYTGPSCSSGPKSFCDPGNIPTCKNGGTCIHVGVAAVRCACTKNFTGPTCETPVDSTLSKDCNRCRTFCPSEGRFETQCKCFDRDKVNTSNSPGERTGFTTTMHLANLPNLNDDGIKQYLRQQILKYLQTNSSAVEDIMIKNIVHFRTGIDVTFHVFSPKKEEKRLRSILNKWEDRGHVGNITVSEKDTYLRSLLSIQSLDINQIGIIREKDQFILSCVARGSPTIVFRWFKDGIFINVTTTSRKWLKLIKDPHVADQYTGLLGVERAHPYDEGIFTCQVEDFNMKECLSKEVLVEKKPSIKIEPVSLTVKKGDNFTIKCITAEESRDGIKYIYSWTKNKELLPVRTEFERYEVLYPSGTILQVKSAEKSVQYSCLVQGSKVSSERIVPVYVVDRKGVYTCPTGVFLEMPWPETAPDTNSILNCPKGYTGLATRYCALKDGRKPAWGLPSFSECTHHQLGRIYDTFERLKLGYIATTFDKLLSGILLYTQRDSYVLLPGEGAKVLSIVHEIMQFISKSKIEESRNITNILFSIIDRVLSTSNSLTQQTEIRTVFELVNEYLSLSGASLLSAKDQFFRISMNTIDLTIVNLTYYQSNKYFHIPNTLDKSIAKWLGVQISGTNVLLKKERTRLAAGIVFRNISSFMSPRLFIRIKDGSELEYEIYSQIVTVLPLPEYFEMYPIAIDFKHQLNHKMNWSDDETWSVKCGYADLSTFTYSWNIYSCYTEVLSDLKTRCICPKNGIFALLLTLTPKSNIEEYESNVYILIIGCALGMVFTLFTTICLAVSCFIKQKSSITILKLQCSSSIFLFGLVFIVAIIIGPTQTYFLFFLTGLETAILLGVSSHLSKLLVIFTELIELPKSMTSKHTVIIIISGVPVITVFASHLSYKTMDIKLESWWILKGTLSFNIFVCVTSIMAVLFVFIYTIVMKKLDNLVEINEKYAKPLHKRVGLLRRSCCIFIFLILFSISSILYINFPNKLWSICQFSVSNTLMGLVILICYIIKSETRFQQMFQRKKKPDNMFFSYNSSNSSPLNFITKQDPEVENDSSPHIRSENQQFTMVSRDSTKSSIAGKSQSIAATFESCLHNIPKCDARIDVAATSHRYKQPSSLEYYNSSPQSFRKFSGATAICSPDILSNKVCVELDLVASSLQRQPNRIAKFSSTAPSSVSPDEAIAKILDYPKEPPAPPPPEVPYKERTQPDGHDESIMCEKVLSTVEEVSETEIDSPENSENTSPVNSEVKNSVPVPSANDSEQIDAHTDNLDGMLDSISQDLEYLLNRSEEVTISTLKRVSKSPASVRHGMGKEVFKDDGDSFPESVTIRSKC